MALWGLWFLSKMQCKKSEYLSVCTCHTMAPWARCRMLLCSTMFILKSIDKGSTTTCSSGEVVASLQTVLLIVRSWSWRLEDGFAMEAMTKMIWYTCLLILWKKTDIFLTSLAFSKFSKCYFCTEKLITYRSPFHPPTWALQSATHPFLN